MKIRLETRDGQFVAEKFVPPFLAMPEVVVWGIRHFMKYDGAPAGAGCSIYREVFAYMIVDIHGGSLKDIYVKPEGQYVFNPEVFNLPKIDHELIDRLPGTVPETMTGYMINEANKRAHRDLSSAVHPLPSYPPVFPAVQVVDDEDEPTSQS